MILVAGIAAGALFVKYYFSPEQKILRFLANGDFDEAVSVYNENFDDEENEALTNALTERLDKLKTQFKNNEIDYVGVKNELSSIREMSIGSIVTKLLETENYVEKLNASRTAFSTGEELLASQDYKGAIEQFRLVIEDDSNYSAAQDKLSTAVNSFRSNALAEAKTYADSGQYSNAIAALNTALLVLENDAELTKQLTIYQNENVGKIRQEALDKAKNYADNDDYPNAIKTLQSALNDYADDVEIQAKLTEYSDAYVTTVIGKVNKLVKKKDYTSAIKALQDALKILPDDETLNEKLDEVNANKPLPLSSLTALNGGWTWNDGTPTDPFGNDYSESNNYVILGDGEYYAEYRVYKKYTSITGKIAPHTSNSENKSCYMQIYADDVLVYTSKTVTRKTDAFKFSVNIADAEYIKIVVYCDDYSMWDGTRGAIILSDIMLWAD